MKRKDNFIMQNVGGEKILVPIGSQVVDLNGLITLNETAAHLWELLAEDCTIEELANALKNEFDIDKNSAKNDVKNFIDEIHRFGILEK